MSSSGHLGLFEMLLDVDAEQARGATVEVALHAGTLLAVIVFLRRDLAFLLRAVFLPARVDPAVRQQAWGIIRGLFYASLPVAAVGVFLRGEVEALFSAPWVIGCGFLLTGLVLFLSRRQAGGRVDAASVRPVPALAIGLAQTLALVPGISRSGMTIVAGLGTKMEPYQAGRFSFLLAIPVVGGAALLKSRDIIDTGPAEELALAVGVGASFLSGLLALALLAAVLRRGRLYTFAWYMFPIGLFALWLASGR